VHPCTEKKMCRVPSCPLRGSMPATCDMSKLLASCDRVCGDMASALRDVVAQEWSEGLSGAAQAKLCNIKPAQASRPAECQVHSVGWRLPKIADAVKEGRPVWMGVILVYRYSSMVRKHAGMDGRTVSDQKCWEHVTST
jgi:hypothetical protein